MRLDGKNDVDPNNSAINEIKYKELRFELGETNKDIMLKVYVMDLEETEKYYFDHLDDICTNDEIESVKEFVNHYLATT